MFLNPWADPLPKPASELGLYIAFCPDAVPSRRAAFRAAHSLDALEGERTGWIVDGGARATEHAGASSTFVGSWLLIREESVEKARARVVRDVYAREGVWALDKIVVFASMSERGLFDLVPAEGMGGSVDERRHAADGTARTSASCAP